jgi:hypothetical protein
VCVARFCVPYSVCSHPAPVDHISMPSVKLSRWLAQSLSVFPPYQCSFWTKLPSVSGCAAATAFGHVVLKHNTFSPPAQRLHHSRSSDIHPCSMKSHSAIADSPQPSSTFLMIHVTQIAGDVRHLHSIPANVGAHQRSSKGVEAK